MQTTVLPPHRYNILFLFLNYFYHNSLRHPQQRFLLRKNENSTDQNVYSWWVPLTYTSSFSHPAEHFWMPGGSDSNQITIPKLPGSPDDWVIFNVGQEGNFIAFNQSNK